MVTSVPEELEDPELMSRQRQCSPQVWAFAASGDGTGAEKMEDPPSLSSFPLVLFLLSPNSATRRGGEHAMNVDGGQTETWARRCAYSFIVDLPFLPT